MNIVKILKKFLYKRNKQLFLLIVFIMANMYLPVIATNWIQIGVKSYIDYSSIGLYNDSEYSKNNYTYSFWVKNLNDNSAMFKEIESIYKKKIWYSMTMNIINCKNKSIAIKSSVDYGLDCSVLGSIDNPYYLLKYTNIVPDSVGELYYNLVCTPNY